MAFPTIPAGQKANEAIGGYDNFIEYLNAVAAGVDANTSQAAQKAQNLADLPDKQTARENLGLGTMATASAAHYALLSGATFSGALRGPNGSAAAPGLAVFTAGSYDSGIQGDGAGFYMVAQGQQALRAHSSLGLMAYMKMRPPGDNPAAVVLRAQGAASQAANAITVENSSASVLASISAAGLGTFAGLASTENVTVTKSQSATTRIGVTNGSSNANALAELRATTDAGYTGLFKHPAAYGGYKILGASDASVYNSTAGHMSFLNDVASGVIRFAAGGASSAQVQIETTGKLTTFTPTTAAASIRLPHGTAPTTPADGDMWTTSAGGLYVRVNGVTKQVQFV